MLLEIGLDLDNLLSIGEMVALLATGFGFFFNMRGKIDILKNDLNNHKANLTKLEDQQNSTYSKIENKIQQLEDKLVKLPQEIIDLFRQLK